MIEKIIQRYINFIDIYYPSHTAAAKELGISRSHLSKIIHRHDNPSLTLLLRMEKIMEENQYPEEVT